MHLQVRAVLPPHGWGKIAASVHSLPHVCPDLLLPRAGSATSCAAACVSAAFAVAVVDAAAVATLIASPAAANSAAFDAATSSSACSSLASHAASSRSLTARRRLIAARRCAAVRSRWDDEMAIASAPSL